MYSPRITSNIDQIVAVIISAGSKYLRGIYMHIDNTTNAPSMHIAV